MTGDRLPDHRPDHVPARPVTHEDSVTYPRVRRAAHAEPLRSAPARAAQGSSGVMQRLRSDPETVERDLVKLVLTLVELIRQLMERQALRRVEGGGLTDDQIEDLGLALMRLEQAMERLKDHFQLEDHDLNLDLGPLGPLLPEP
ncbi:gas vesicle protein K [Actinomadura rudentiformis]|nr:gas vesicle protein K [Actinomadura rudentiformis]